MDEINMAPKKLLIIVNALGIGGAEQMIYELVKFINRDQYCPEILCYGKRQGNFLESKIAEICNVRYIGLTGKINVTFMRKVISVITEINPDVIHAHQGGVTFAIPWCAIRRKPLCLTVHSKPQQAFSSLNNCMIYMFKHILNMKIVAVSNENLTLVKKYYKLSDKKSECVNNGVDLERFYKIPHNGFVFINVARQDKNKNQIAIIRAIHRMIKSGKNVHLILVGDGPCHDDLKAEVSELGISEYVFFAGQVSDPTEYYAKSDVYVQTSFREALPLSVLEAMASELPIIVTRVGGLSDIVDQNGILIEAGNDDELFSAMNRIADVSEIEYQVMASNSKKIVENYSSARMAEQYEHVYDKLFGRRK